MYRSRLRSFFEIIRRLSPCGQPFLCLFESPGCSTVSIVRYTGVYRNPWIVFSRDRNKASLRYPSNRVSDSGTMENQDGRTPGPADIDRWNKGPHRSRGSFYGRKEGWSTFLRYHQARPGKSWICLLQVHSGEKKPFSAGIVLITGIFKTAAVSDTRKGMIPGLQR